MKILQFFLLVLVLLLTSAQLFGQKISYPAVARKDDELLTVKEIETTDKYTVVSFERLAPSNGTSPWVSVDKGIFIQDVYGTHRFPSIKVDGIPVTPGRHYFSAPNEKLAFKVYFKKLPADITFIDIKEKDVVGAQGSFNCYGVNLKQTFLLVPNLVSQSAIGTKPANRAINYPAVARKDDKLLSVNRIEVTDEHTVVTFEHPNPPFVGDSRPSVSMGNEMYIRDMYSKASYKFLKAEGIPMYPQRHYYSKPGEVLTFKVYFEKLPDHVTMVDIIAREGQLFHFNSYGVSLTNSFQLLASTEKTALPAQVISASPPLPSVLESQEQKQEPPFSNEMEAMHHMLLKLYQLQLEYMTSQETIQAIARATKMRYDALRAEGFSKKQALEIIKSSPINPIPTNQK